MRGAPRLSRRLAHWLRLQKSGDELRDELAEHRAMIEDELVRGGMSREDAHAEARRRMGNETTMREQSRSVWVGQRLEGLLQDMRATMRSLARSPGFAAAVVVTFALGIGANTAMFSLIDRLLFRPPAYMRDPDGVNRVYLYRLSMGKQGTTGGQYARHADLARFTTQFSDVAAYSLRPLAVGGGQNARELRVGVVSANFFGFFDAPPALGRYFTAAEDSLQSPTPVVVLSYAYWQSQFGGLGTVLGSNIQVGTATYKVIGVAPKGFNGIWPYSQPVAYIPVTAFGASTGRPNWARNYGSFIGISTLVRRKPGVTLDAASADLTAAFISSFRAESGPAAEERLASLKPHAVAGHVLAERGPERSTNARIATWLSGVAVIVLLIACANIANLLLARAFSRRREIAVRIALGVSRVRLATHLLSESVLLAIAGGIAGVLTGAWASALLQQLFLPGSAATSVLTDARTLLFSGVVAVVVGLGTGAAPMLQTRRLGLTDDLKSGARDGGARWSRARVGLLVAQGALSLVLLVGAGLFVESVRNARDVRLGYDAEPVLIVRPNFRGVRLDSATTVALRTRLLAAAQSTPGVRFASLQETIPFAAYTSYPIFVAGVDSAEKFGFFEFNRVSADYFQTMGTHVIRGRGVEATDVDGAERVAVVGASMANVLWPGQDPIGQCVRIGRDTTPCTYVVGVAEDIRAHSLEDEGKFYQYYLPAAQFHPEEGGLFVRASGNSAGLAEPLRAALQREMPGAAYVTVTRLGDVVDSQMRTWNLGMTLFIAFGALAMILAAFGLYSVIAYAVTQRRREIAVRVALGARTTSVLRLIVGAGVRLGAAGVVVGTIIALVASRWVAPLLFNVSPRDPAVFISVAALLLVVAVLASVVPALRASKMDPRTALQAD
ncbi:MAG TPA: ADOP family duplicated permease [Gemmatimonadaceae bacterium]|nr:ADOP family duplicated permease [Gemmatimonadaceae bacterium]